MGRRLRRWLALDPGARWRLMAFAPALWGLHAGLAVLGYRRMRNLVERLSRHATPAPASSADVETARDLARLAAIASHYALGDASCLRRSLLLYALLRRRGLQPCLLLGVAGQDGVLGTRAHAWVELADTRLLDSDAGYRPFVHPQDARAPQESLNR